MSANTSPSHYTEDAFVTDANFKVEINQKMKVPDKISFNNDINELNQNGWIRDNIDMQVPERIVLMGQDRHVGTRAPPREIVYDNSLVQTEPSPGDVRVATPPRNLTLDKYEYPGLKNCEEIDQIQVSEQMTKKEKLQQLNLLSKELTPPIGGHGEKLTPSEEILHLRKQMAKLNRRIMALEGENLSRLQKEKFLVGFGVAYLLLRVIIWMNRD